MHMCCRMMLQRSLRLSEPLQRHHVTHLSQISRSPVTLSRRLQPAQYTIHSSSRLYSTPVGEGAEASRSKGPPPSTETPPEADAEDSLKKKVEAQAQEIIDLKDKYLRSVADFRNLQERTKRDVSSARDFAISRFAKDLIDSVDNLDRALSTVPVAAVTPSAGADAPPLNKDLVNLHDGLKMTEQVMMQTLAKHGLERYDPAEKEDKFDPNLHEANFMAPIKGKDDGAVFTTIQKGFILNGRVIRAAKVGVVKNS